MEAKRQAEAAAAVEDAYFMPLADEQDELLRGGVGKEEGVVNTSFEEDTYLQPRSGNTIESDHESDDDQRKSHYLPMTDKRNTLPQIVLSEADVPKSDHIAPKSDHLAPESEHNAPQSPPSHTYENQTNQNVPVQNHTAPTYENQPNKTDSPQNKADKTTNSKSPTENDDVPVSEYVLATEEKETRPERNKLTRQPAEHSVEEDVAEETLDT